MNAHHALSDFGTILERGARLPVLQPGSPAGEDLEYDPAMQELERTVLGKAEAEYGGELIPAVPPDWKQALTLCRSLMERSHDMRIGVLCCRALAHEHGAEGLAAGLHYIERQLEQHWPDLHPHLDPLDDHDPLQRMNALVPLVRRDALLGDLGEMALIAVRGHGTVRGADLDAARAGPANALSAVIAAVPPAQLAGLADVLQSAAASAHAIRGTLVRVVRPGHVLDLEPLCDALERMHSQVRQFAPTASDHTASADGVDDRAVVSPSAAHGRGASSPQAIHIASREDVLLLLDQICTFYRTHEPSSPVPLLLERVRRIVPKNFVEILEDLAPDALPRFLEQAGPPA